MLMKEFHKVPHTGIVVLLSGGLDSSTLVSTCVEAFGRQNVHPISFDYGQKHKRELTAAMAIASYYQLRNHKLIDMSFFAKLAPTSSQTNPLIAVPEGHYADASMKLTVVPNRNSVMLNLAVAYAIGLDVQTVGYAAHAGDHAIYPDCRSEFVEAEAKVFELCDYKPVHLFTPFMGMSKRAIAMLARGNGTPIEFTYSCYVGEYNHCGKCGTCVERKEALEGFDPTRYE